MYSTSSFYVLVIITQVHNIVDKACKELAMEKMIKDLEVSWKTLEFDHETHKVVNLSLKNHKHRQIRDSR